jgi:hypothetical protein
MSALSEHQKWILDRDQLELEFKVILKMEKYSKAE